MTKFVNITHKRPEFEFLDGECIGRNCFRPDNRGSAVGGSRYSGFCCGYRAFPGCPNPLPEFDNKRASERKSQGWRLAE